MLLSSPVAAPPVTSMPEGMVRMGEIQGFVEASSPRGRQDGVACFNYMYAIVTAKVAEAIAQGFFEDAGFMSALDVAFINLYLDALRADATGSGDPPRSWQALLESRSEPRVCSIQFAVAGMNAHVNFDLSRAVVGACTSLGEAPDSGTRRADYDRVNRILGAEMHKIRQHFQNRLEDWIDDHVLGQVDDAIGRWSIDAARDTAWASAELLWSIRADSFGTGLLLTCVDRLVGLAGRGLLMRL